MRLRDSHNLRNNRGNHCHSSRWRVITWFASLFWSSQSLTELSLRLLLLIHCLGDDKKVVLRYGCYSRDNKPLIKFCEIFWDISFFYLVVVAIKSRDWWKFRIRSIQLELWLMKLLGWEKRSDPVEKAKSLCIKSRIIYIFIPIFSSGGGKGIFQAGSRETNRLEQIFIQ